MQWADTYEKFDARLQEEKNFCIQEVASLVFENFQNWGLLLGSKCLPFDVAANEKRKFIHVKSYWFGCEHFPLKPM